jgi:hypothetical protein
MCPGYQLAGERLRDRRQDQVRLAQRRRQVSIPERTVNSQAAITAVASLFASTTGG